jgi:3D (Asp-Asp-Asp) domain-containing protein
MSDLQPARATFYGSFEGRYGAETARVNPVTDQAFAETGVTIAVDPNVIPYGSRVLIPKYAGYSMRSDGIFYAHDTGSDVVKRIASHGTVPVIYFFNGDAKTEAELDALNEKWGYDIEYRILDFETMI